MHQAYKWSPPQGKIFTTLQWQNSQQHPCLKERTLPSKGKRHFILETNMKDQDHHVVAKVTTDLGYPYFYVMFLCL